MYMDKKHMMYSYFSIGDFVFCNSFRYWESALNRIMKQSFMFLWFLNSVNFMYVLDICLAMLFYKAVCADCTNQAVDIFVYKLYINHCY